jgi:hypothetical protein
MPINFPNKNPKTGMIDPFNAAANKPKGINHFSLPKNE